eukprot:Lithocolla_globosa_v1_NODE_6485_length_1080_cov_88.395122.p1 type:complete len:275 gc:universal NODE_6485_length_1080_cov_88.395122:190-1014(+)
MAPLQVVDATHPFSWKNLMADPKQIQDFSQRGDWYKTMQWESLHTGGFLRICTSRGRMYWLEQNMQEHKTADWKLHFSVSLAQIPLAWDILCQHFLHSFCEIGMKASTHAFEGVEWPSSQMGREITVYIYNFNEKYKTGSDIMPESEQHVFYLGPEIEAVYDQVFWFKFIRQAERKLKDGGIKANNLADGDFPLPGCCFTSLRNEAFVLHDQGSERRLIYPPNERGWNAAMHPNPLAGTIEMLQSVEDLEGKEISRLRQELTQVKEKLLTKDFL